jgi:thiol-disulfide isomerase/thioredoxin
MVLSWLGLAAHVAVAASIGSPAPALSLRTASGDAVDLSALRGKVVYVDFWASWCTPCRRAFPWMSEMQKKYGPSGFTIIAVNVDKKREDAERFLQGFAKPPFSVVYDPDGRTPALWEVKGMPSSFLVDGKGNVAAVETGFHDTNVAELENRIKALLAAK